MFERDKEDEQNARRRSRSYVEDILRDPTQSEPNSRNCSRHIYEMGSKKKGGFTLIESLLTMVVIAATVVAVGQILNIALDSYSLIVNRREALHEARIAVNMITGELLSIANPAMDIASISPTAITFTPAVGGAVTYSIVGSDLKRGADTLASNVMTGSGFVYYAAGGGAINNFTQNTLVHRIRINVEVDTGFSQQGKVTLSDDVYLRNRYYNGFIQM